MTEQERQLVRAAFAALAGKRRGWLKDDELDATVRALETYLAETDGPWHQRWSQLEAKAIESTVQTSANSKTLEKFSGYMAQLYVFAKQTIDTAVANAGK